jgi:hypothetical protein
MPSRSRPQSTTSHDVSPSGDRFLGAAVAENVRHGASDVRQEVFADCGHYVAEELAGLLLSFFDGM